MGQPSVREVEFIIGLTTAGCRLDLRELDEEREVLFKINNKPKADKSIFIKQGYSELEIDLLFKSTELTLEHLKYNRDAFKTVKIDESTLELKFKNFNGSEVLFRNITEDPVVLQPIKDFLTSFKLGAIIEVNIVTNDGNIFDIFLKGMQLIFSDISVPNIENLDEDIVTSQEVPSSSTYAIINDTIVNDPTYLEELASEGIIHIINFDGTLRTIVEGRPIKFEKVCEVLNLFNSKNKSISG